MILPFIFILSSIFMFLAIIGEDSCTSGTAIGESYISQYGDAYCPDVLSGTGTLDNCQFNWTLQERFGDDANITISVDVLETYNALLQDQCNSGDDPFEEIALDVAAQVRDLPLEAALKSSAGSKNAIRGALQDIINTTAINYGQVLYDIIAETHADGTKVMSCESMTLIYPSMEDTLCEGVVLPGAWLIGSWYLLGWVICCCGLPSSCATLVGTKLVREEALVGDDQELEQGEERSQDGDEENALLDGDHGELMYGGERRGSHGSLGGERRGSHGSLGGERRGSHGSLGGERRRSHGSLGGSRRGSRDMSAGVEMIPKSTFDGGSDMVLLGASENGDDSALVKRDESIRGGDSTDQGGDDHKPRSYRSIGESTPNEDTLL